MNELAEVKKNEISWWDSEELTRMIKQKLAPNANDFDWFRFTETSKNLNLNPFMGEITLTSFRNGKTGEYDSTPIIQRQGYIKIARRSPEFNGLTSDAIYSNQQIIKDHTGRYTITSSYSDRGKLVGAIASVNIKGADYPITVEVSLSEYMGYNLWKSKPETMIKKVAESQAIRKAFPELFNGTYDETERWETTDNNKKSTRTSAVKIGTPRPKPSPVEDPQFEDAEYEIDETTGEVVEQAPVKNEKALLMLTEEAVNLNSDNVEKYKAKCVELTKFDYPDEFTDVETLRDLYRYVKQLIKEQ